MNSRRSTLALLLAVLTFAVAPLSVAAAPRPSNFVPTAAAAAAFAGGVTVPVPGTTSRGGKFTGSFAIKEFRAVGDQVVAAAALTGAIQNSAGNVLGAMLKTVQMLVNITGASCDILHLELGPLDLNLLGLEVHLNRVVLDIDADATGGLLGALLCAVANLLNVGARWPRPWGCSTRYSDCSSARPTLRGGAEGGLSPSHN